MLHFINIYVFTDICKKANVYIDIYVENKHRLFIIEVDASYAGDLVSHSPRGPDGLATYSIFNMLALFYNCTSWYGENVTDWLLKVLSEAQNQSMFKFYRNNWT